jgi:transmembrane sensor
MGHQARPTRDQIRQEAAKWVVRLAGPCSEEDRAAFEAWRAASFAHDAAYEREALAWEILDRLRAFRPDSEAVDADLLAPPANTRLTDDWRAPRWAAAAVMVVVIAALASISLGSWVTPAYATGVGERRVITLSDGSRIELNTDSKVVIRYSAKARRVDLVRGEALFEVVADARPFKLTAKNMALQTLHSQMALRLHADTALVTVREGSVSVRSGSASEAAHLDPSTEGQFGPARAVIRPISSEMVNQRLVWRQGAIAFSGESLSQAAEEFNRYNTRKIIVTDPSIREFHLAGYFQSNDLISFVGAVTRTFPVKASSRGDGAIMLSRRRPVE